MIKTLRKKFIGAAMFSTFVVLAVIMVCLNLANYLRMTERADNMIELLKNSDGKLGQTSEKPGQKQNNSVFPENISPEAPFETRYFIVRLDETGECISKDMGKIAAVSEEEAEAYAGKVWEKGRAAGFEGIYRYSNTKEEKGTLLVFLDCRRELSSFQTLAITTCTVSMAGLLAVLILVLLFSRLVFRPVEESVKKQKQFITDASHEIKTPLTIIDANTEVLEMEYGESPWTQSTRNQVKRLTGLTQQLIVLSRMDEETRVQEKAEFSLTETVEEILLLFQAPLKTGGNTLEADIQENIRFYGNEKAIRQLLEILLDNVVKYSLPQGLIRISLQRRGRQVQLCVWNQTRELPKGKLDVLFERFYRMDSSRNSKTGGSGIGLSVAKAVVTAHKGKIHAVSDDGKSLRIMVIFKVPG